MLWLCSIRRILRISRVPRIMLSVLNGLLSRSILGLGVSVCVNVMCRVRLLSRALMVWRLQLVRLISLSTRVICRGLRWSRLKLMPDVMLKRGKSRLLRNTTLILW